MAKRKFVFDDLPDDARMRIYHFLGFPTFSDVVMGTDILQHYNIKLTLRNVYKLDLSSDGSLSVPWNVSQREHLLCYSKLTKSVRGQRALKTPHAQGDGQHDVHKQQNSR
jgi:hypothetical protein